ncbi:MAG: hypothetical protein IJX62_09300 [Clostridia bacterium]|nr:hypothetical protein [Clostridia bacterium]
MKKIVAVILAVVLLLGGCLGVFFYCSAQKAPTVEEIYDRVVYLVENSHELNTVFYGAGLPTHAADSVYAEINHIYHNFYYTDTYEMVSSSAKFLTSTDIKNAAEKVYSKAYLEDVVYPSLFTGHAISDASGNPHFAHARYLEDNNWIYQAIQKGSYYRGILVYDYSTMRVAKPSNNKMCFVEIDCWDEDAPQSIRTQRLTLVRQNGLWYLDSFAG